MKSETKVIKKKRIIPTIIYILAFLMIAYVLRVDYQIYKNNQNAFVDIYEDKLKEEEKDSSTLNLQTHDLEVLGMLYVPRIDLSLPIYNTKSENEMESMDKQTRAENYGTALWYKLDDLNKGNGTRALLSSHNGLSIGELFTSLPKLKMNDKFYIKLKGVEEPLTYQIFEMDKTLPNGSTIKRDTLNDDGTINRIVYDESTGKYQNALIKEHKGLEDNENVILKDEAKDIKSSTYFDDSKELVTLQTCVPIFVNSHRLLMTGERVAYDGKVLKQNSSLGLTQILFFVVIAIIILLIIKLIVDIINNVKFRKIKKQQLGKNQLN